jgi:hypothetical protein
MENKGSLVGGILLIVFGALALLGKIFGSFDFWGTVWPFFVIGFGAMFFVGMAAGGKSVSGLAIPGSIISVIGLMLFVQNLTGHWESWAYSWTIIVISVGLGIFIMGYWGGDEGQRQAGWRLMKLGAILLIIFGSFFETIFNSFGSARFLFPVALIGLGVYLILNRSGILSNQKKMDAEKIDPPLE